jgi:uncharacterized membrane protein
MYRFGGNLSITAGFIFLISGIAFFLTQVGKFDWNSIGSISDYVQSTSYALSAWKIVNLGAAFASFLAIAGVVSLSRLLNQINEDWITWASTLAIIGYSVIAVTNIADLYQIQRLSSNYPFLSSDAQSAIEAMGSGTLDPFLGLRFFTIGAWLISIGWLSFRDSQLPRPLAGLAVFAGTVSLIFVASTLLEIQGFSLLAGSLAVIFHPIWLIWLGIILRRK